jgi:hypothetical protein
MVYLYNLTEKEKSSIVYLMDAKAIWKVLAMELVYSDKFNSASEFFQYYENEKRVVGEAAQEFYKCCEAEIKSGAVIAVKTIRAFNESNRSEPEEGTVEDILDVLLRRKESGEEFKKLHKALNTILCAHTGRPYLSSYKGGEPLYKRYKLKRPARLPHMGALPPYLMKYIKIGNPDTRDVNTEDVD